MPTLDQIGKAVLALGIVISIAGVILLLLGKLGVARLPGDIFIKRDGVRIFIPIVSMILVSVILTVVLNVVLWILRRF